MSDQNNEQTERFHEGKEHSHQANDSKDSRTIANKLAREEQVHFPLLPQLINASNCILESIFGAKN